MLVQADFREVAAFIKRLEKAEATRVRKAIRNAVTEVATDATKRVQDEADTFSKRIGPQTKLKVSFAARGAGATIATNLKVVPWARLYERGGRKTNASYWKHPVFGSASGGKSSVERIREQTKARYEKPEHWPKQDTHPFFYSKVWAEKDELKTKLAGEVEKILKEIATD